MDEHRARRRERIAAARRPVGEEQAAIHTRHEGSQAATAGSRTGRHFEMRRVTVARRAMGAPNFIGDFLGTPRTMNSMAAPVGTVRHTLKHWPSGRDPRACGCVCQPPGNVYKGATLRRRGFMKYRHQYHAGNFADVHKHVLLLEVLRALTRKDKGLLFVDTHAGRGEYDLHPGDSRTSGRVAGGRREAARGRAAACGAHALSRPGGCRHARRQSALPGLPAARGAHAAPRGSRSILRNAARRSRSPAQGLAGKQARARRRRGRFPGFARAAAAAGAARLRAHRPAL